MSHRNRHFQGKKNRSKQITQTIRKNRFELDLNDLPFNVMENSGSAIKTYLNQEVALLRPQVSYSEIAHLFRTAVTARSAIELRAESLRQVDFKIANAAGELLEEGDPKFFTPRAQGIQAAFQSNFQSIIERSETSYCCYGEVLLRRLKTQSGILDGFQWINNNFFRRETDTSRGLGGFHIRPVWGSELEPDLDWLPPEDTVYFHNIDFFEDFGGTGPLMVAYAQAATETEITATQLMFFRNMAMPSFVIQPADGSSYVPGPDQKLELSEYLRRMYQGAANAGRTVVLPTRWEMLKFQQDFDKLGMPNLTDQARDACLRILRVPLELIEPRQAQRAQGTKFYDQKREWLISWLVPQSERYADIFTEQVAKPLNPEWRIVPTFKRVRGLDEDISSRTDTVSKQLKDGVLDLANAQKTLGLNVDENLTGLYLIGGIPVPSAEMQNYWRVAPGNPGMVSGGENAKPDKPSRTGESTPRAAEVGASTEATAPTAPTGKSVDPIPFLPDAQHKELKNWRVLIERKGRNYAFKSDSLPAHAVAFGRFLLSGEEPSESIWNAIRVQAVKGYEDTEAQYRTALYELMTDAFQGNLNRNQFGVAGRSEIEMAFLNAFKNGMQEAGTDPAEMTDEEKSALDLETKQERSYWTALANDMYRNVIPLRETPEFSAARNAMLSRIELWINKGLQGMKILGNMYGKMNGMKKFTLGGTKDHCETCSGADGQVHRARTWLKYGIYPRSDSCICTGINCLCTLDDTTEPANGSLAGVPIAGTKSHDHHDHEHNMVIDTEAVAI